MARHVPLFSLIGVLVVALAGPPASAASDPSSGRYIVVLQSGTDARQAAERQADRFGFTTSHVYRHALDGYAARMSSATARSLESLPSVAWVEPDRVVRATAQTLPTGINRADADLSPTAGINGVDQRVDVDVAVLDTGVANHADLNVYRAGAKDCIAPVVGTALDDHGHGTHVAGTIGAIDNASGVVGVAPGARIWPVKVLNAAGMGLVSQIVCGIDYVTSKAAQIEVANMSLGGGGSDDGNCGQSNGDSEHVAICSSVGAGVTYVVAAGNDHVNAASSTPAAYDEVITVSALADFNGLPGGGAPASCRSDQDDTFADFSNYGADVDLIAPGVCILSTSMTGGTATMSGTSMASPHAAGGAALYAATNPAAGPAEIRSAVISAGTLDWTWPSQDLDTTKERLLNVASF